MPGEGYGLQNPAAAILGFVDADTPNEMGHSNLEYLGFGGLSDGTLAGTGVSVAVPVAVQPGDTVSAITVLVGATAEATGTHAFAALYSGIAVPALLAQSPDVTGAAAMAASAKFTFTLATPYQIKPADALNGFIYVAICVTAGTVPTAASSATPTAVGYQWTTNGPLFLSATAGSAQGATAAPTLVTPTAKATAPIVILT